MVPGSQSFDITVILTIYTTYIYIYFFFHPASILGYLSYYSLISSRGILSPWAERNAWPRILESRVFFSAFFGTILGFISIRYPSVSRILAND